MNAGLNSMFPWVVAAVSKSSLFGSNARLCLKLASELLGYSVAGKCQNYSKVITVFLKFHSSNTQDQNSAIYMTNELHELDVIEGCQRS